MSGKNVPVINPERQRKKAAMKACGVRGKKLVKDMKRIRRKMKERQNAL